MRYLFVIERRKALASHPLDCFPLNFIETYNMKSLIFLTAVVIVAACGEVVAPSSPIASTGKAVQAKRPAPPPDSLCYWRPIVDIDTGVKVDSVFTCSPTVIIP
jgi:hypothetical protein